MTPDDAARTGLLMLCTVTAGPFLAGLLIGWQIARRWLASGWRGFIPGFIQRLLEDGDE
jgi:hypothetical protein